MLKNGSVVLGLLVGLLGGCGDKAADSAAAGSAAAESKPTVAAKAAGSSAPAATAAARADEEKAAAASPPSRAVSPSNVAVKSGEWDDNANYREFQKYLASAPKTNPLDISKRRFLVVTDKDGKPVPNCKVLVEQGQSKTELVTTSSGRALFFAGAEGMGAEGLKASTSCAGEGSATFDLKSDDAAVKIATKGVRSLSDDRVVDLVFVLDTTGSMSEEIDALVATIQRVADMLEKEKVTLRLGLVEFKDRGDSYRTKKTAMSKDIPGFIAMLKTVQASGGGDVPEDVNEGLRVAVEEMEWSDSSVARLAFVIGDAPPHLDYQDGVSYAKSSMNANHRGIVVHTIAASGMDEMGQSVFRQMAQVTGGATMFVLRGGAGPQSSGGGDPKSSCGGTQQSYKSGDLHSLVTNKVYAALAAADDDAMKIAGLGKDEDAKPCEQRVMPAAYKKR